MREVFQSQLEERTREEGWKGWVGLTLRTARGMTVGAWSEWRSARKRRKPPGGGPGFRIRLELRHALRRLKRNPAFTVLTVATLGLGIGSFSSVYSVVDSVLLEPMPYEHPHRLAWVWRDYSDWFDITRGWLGGPDVAWMQEERETFEAVAAVRSGRMNLTARVGVEPREVRTTATSAVFFDLLGVSPARGRGFLPGEDHPDATPVAVLTHGLWMDAFGGAPGLVGGEIYLDGEVFTVIGILPRKFAFLMPTSLGDPVPAEVFVPLRMNLTAQDRGNGFLAGLVRTREGVSLARVEGSLASVAHRVDEGWSGGELRLRADPMKENLVAGVRPALVAILAGAALLLLILAGNLAVLLLARTSGRSQELAVRTALGGGRGAIAGSVLVEVGLLAMGGGLLGLLLGVWGTDLLAAVAAHRLPRAAEISLDGSVVAMALGLSVALGALVSMAPLVRALGGHPGRTLREGSERTGESLRRARGRSLLVVVQVALSVVLLVEAGLLARSMAGLLASDPGFDPEETLTLRIALDPGAYGEDAAVLDLVSSLERRLGSLPEVEAVGFTDGLPLRAAPSQSDVHFPGAPGNRGDHNADNPLVDRLRASPGYFAAAGFRMLQGRAFRSFQVAEGSLEVVIDDVLAGRFFPDGSAVGAPVLVSPTDTALVAGVVDQARAYDVHRDDRGQVYLPLGYGPPRALSVALRTTGSPEALVAPSRAVVRELDPALPVSEVETLEEIVQESLSRERINLQLLGSFALASLLLASLGVYGVVANAVVRRRREMGLRMAMGATASEVVRAMLRQGGRLVLGGVLLGLAAAALLSRFLTSLLYGVASLDLLTYAGVALGLSVVAGVAAWIPARRVTRIRPWEALR
jgi:predicted permease